MADVKELATGLQFPEGPVCMPDGSVILVEIRRGTLSRVTTGGDVEVVADLGGGPNGAAIGPDGAVYVCNNGGFKWSEIGELIIPMELPSMTNEPEDFEGGWIERVDLATGASEVLYRECGGHALRSPNDIVFDTDGGFWFTDLGKTRHRAHDRGGLYYAKTDGSSVVEASYGLFGANGVGLSPDGKTVYVAESYTGRLNSWALDGPGSIVGGSHQIVTATKGHFDSLAVEADGTVAVAAIGDGVCRVSTDGTYEYVAMPDPFVTNVCFGGDDLRTAFVTLSGGGRLISMDWPGAGLKLNY